MPGLIPEDDIVAVFCDKAKRSKGKEKVIEGGGNTASKVQSVPVINVD